jgi:hypothetical protein
MTKSQHLFFNVLTFDLPSEPVTLYFCATENDALHRIYKDLVPEDVIETLFPNGNESDHVYTSFLEETEGTQAFEIDLQSCSASLAKRYAGNQLIRYFKEVAKVPLKSGFIDEIQVWVKAKQSGNPQYDEYLKFSLKVQLRYLSRHPEIQLSYDGTSKVFKENSVELGQEIGSDKFNWVLYEGQLRRWKHLKEAEEQGEEIDYEQVFPHINRDLAIAINLPYVIPPQENRYTRYLKNINGFVNKFLIAGELKDYLELYSTNFLKVNQTKINQTSPDSNHLLFGNKQTDIFPKTAIKKHKPYKSSPFSSIKLFFIMHEDDVPTSRKIFMDLIHGQKSNSLRSPFPGLYKYVNLIVSCPKELTIIFKEKDNPIDVISRSVSELPSDEDDQLMAIYITPYDKFVQDREKREYYHRIKEILLNHNITSQVIDPRKMEIQNDFGWSMSLTNIALAMLAKLDGIPWRLKSNPKKELVVGVGAFKQVEEDTRYIASSFVFENNGIFNRFDYYHESDIDVLAGSIAEAVTNYSALIEEPQRLIIHFYKTMSQDEIYPIQKELNDLDLKIPIFIITVNKTESEDIVAFDSSWPELMPESGTFINIGRNRYLLFNNTRYSTNNKVSTFDGFPFPLKLKFQCTDKELLEDSNTIRELIDQVYQFSRMYWKSLRQQNLPVTIKYPEMVAQIAPHFIGNDIPDYGKNNLWFL